MEQLFDEVQVLLQGSPAIEQFIRSLDPVQGSQ